MFAARNIDVKAELPSELEIAFSCRLERSAESLFEAWTTPEHLRHWWGCEGSQITHCVIDLKVGGSWSLSMRMQDGSEHPFHGIYREIVRPHRLVYTECYDMPQFGSPEWLSTVTFEELDRATLITQNLKHRTREARDGHLQAGMQQGAIDTLVRLNEYTATMTSTQSTERSKR